MAIGKSGPGSKLSAGQAAYVLDRLIRERRVSMGDVSGYLSQMNSEIDELEQRLQELREAQGGGRATAGAPATPAPAPTVRKRRRRRGRPPAAESAPAPAAKGAKKRGGAKRGRKRAVTAEQIESRKLQGRYLALVRQFPASRRGIYSKIARERGREAAIKSMKDAIGK